MSANRELLFQLNIPASHYAVAQTLLTADSLPKEVPIDVLSMYQASVPAVSPNVEETFVADDYAHTYAPFIQAAVREVGHNYRQAAKWLTRERSYRRLTGYGLSAVLTAFPFCSVILGWPMSCPPDVQGCLCLAALHRPGQWLFRVASHQRRRSKATLCRRNEERLTLRPSRTVRTGVTRTQVSGSAPLPGSRCPRTSWWVKSTTGCPLS